MNKLPNIKVVTDTEVQDTKVVTDAIVPTPKTTKTAAPKLPATVTIKCVDCGAEREIARGEQFQVTRCKECQIKHSKVLRKQYRKDKVKKLKERILKLEILLQEHSIDIPARLLLD